MQLYGRRSSINVQKVLWCFAELGMAGGRDFRRVDAGLQFGVVDTPEYRALNPNGLVPTLIDKDLVLWESNAIVRYLAATRGDGRLLPTDPAQRADVERWMDWQLATLWSTLRIAFLGLTRTPEAQRDKAAIADSYAKASQQLAIVNRTLTERDYISASGFTVADIGLALSAHRWIGLGRRFTDVVGEPDALNALSAWLQRVTARKGFALATAA